MNAQFTRTTDLPRSESPSEPQQTARPVLRESGGPIGYLKFWGVDYPYLAGASPGCRRDLPLPVDSEAQRLVRQAHLRAGVIIP